MAHALSVCSGDLLIGVGLHCQWMCQVWWRCVDSRTLISVCHGLVPTTTQVSGSLPQLGVAHALLLLQDTELRLHQLPCGCVTGLFGCRLLMMRWQAVCQPSQVCTTCVSWCGCLCFGCSLHTCLSRSELAAVAGGLCRASQH